MRIRAFALLDRWRTSSYFRCGEVKQLPRIVETGFFFYFCGLFSTKIKRDEYIIQLVERDSSVRFAA